MARRYSHPADGSQGAVELRDHLDDVASRAQSTELIPDDKRTDYGSQVNEIVARLGQIHDLGKATTWFQQYIGEQPGDPGENPTHHAPLGALVAYYVLDATGYEPEECLAGYVAVATHHGSLPNVAEYVGERTYWSSDPGNNSVQRDVLAQVENVDEHAPALAEEIVSDATDGRGSWSEVAERIQDRSLFEEIQQTVVYRINPDPRAVPTELYPTLIQCWSGLTLADKTSAAHVPTEGYRAEQPHRSTLQSYIDDLGGDGRSERERRLNDHRHAARQDVLESVDSFLEADGDVATLTLPTGLGKTLTGLDTALKIRDATDRQRVVYALPFTSIIDQVADEVESIFDAPPTGRTLTVHHHLAETVTQLEDAEIHTDERAAIEELLGESWQTGMVVTTFVQLLESLVGPANSQSLKLPALYDSVIVLDEPQGIPHDWWTLVRELARLLTEQYDATVVAMTATQPEIFGDEAVELVAEQERYFESIDRVEYVFDDSVAAYPDEDRGPVPLDRAAERLAARVRNGESVLSVCNTIDSARSLTDALEGQVDGVDSGAVYADLLEAGTEPDGAELAEAVGERADGVVTGHLTTRLRPKDRLRILDAIKELREQDVPLAVVSTQLIEAGVDVSFDRVYRDLAPLDSVVQAAGRCNRSFECEQGTVTVWWLANSEDGETTPADAVYERWGDSLLSVTVEELASEGVFRGAEDEQQPVEAARVSKDAVEAYYQTLAEERNVGKQEYVEYLEQAQCEEAGALSLIDQQRSVDVIVCRTPEEREQIKRIKIAWNQREYDRLENLIDDTKSSKVSIPVYGDSALQEVQSLRGLHEESDIRWTFLENSEYDAWFDRTTGLSIPDSTVEARFL